MERTREMHIAERERRLAILNRLMEENDLAVMVCHGNGAMAYQADNAFVFGGEQTHDRRLYHRN